LGVNNNILEALMSKVTKRTAGIVSLLTLVAGLAVSTAASAAGHAKMLEEGKRISFDKKLGNCLACHMIAGGKVAGNIAPPLIAMKARFPDKAVLRAQIYDATVKNPDSRMPPFGKHKALTDQEVDLVTDYIHTL